MAKKGMTALGGFIGAIIGFGLFALVIFLSSLMANDWAFLPMSIAAWLIGGFVAGIIARGPGRGALAGLLMSAFTFAINAIIMIFLAILSGSIIFTVLFEILTLGLFEAGELPAEVIIVLVLIGLLIAFIFSVISAIFNVSAGALGGLVRKPDKKDAYQDYPAK